MSETPHLPSATRRRIRRFQLIWLVPAVAIAIAAYLLVQNLADRGPLITISFATANGISAQQTQVQHKAVNLGTVEDVRLADDFKSVVVKVRMNHQGAAILTDHARFWVVRPRLTPGNISGLETLVSGAYIEVDPGEPGGSPAQSFKGLEDPPATRSDEPGRTFVLSAGQLGSIGPGAPIFYRDVNVGEVLSYDLGDGFGPVLIHVFVRDPYDKFVHPSSHFWNASGLSVNVGAQGVHVELESIQALFSGGIAFETPHMAATSPLSPPESQFKLFDNKDAADSAGFQRNIPFVTYFKSSVAGLSAGSAVQVFGIQIGTVDSVQLVVDPRAGHTRARVTFELQPERFLSPEEIRAQADPETLTSELVAQGMRAVLASSNLLTGQQSLSLQFVPNAASASLGHEGAALVMPSEAGGLDNITASVSDIAAKLDRIPLDQIGQNLNSTLAAINQAANSAQTKAALQNLASTLADARDLVRHADAGLTPALDRLPQIARNLQDAVNHASDLLGDGGYGANSDFNRNISRLLDQVNEAARSIRLLADFLERHPEALVRGRTGQAAEK